MVEVITDTNDVASLRLFSSNKKQILLILKREKEIDLETLSTMMSMSKMGVLKHIIELEEIGFVERLKKKTGVGRPRLILKLSPNASDIFPKSYASMTTFALNFIEEKLGRAAVMEILYRRQQQIIENYSPNLIEKPFEEKVKELTKLREEDGYMAELEVVQNNNFQMLEYNCPVYDIAEQYGEACTVERQMFEQLLGAEVDTTHRVVSGDKVCRFCIKKRMNNQK